MRGKPFFGGAQAAVLRACAFRENQDNLIVFEEINGVFEGGAVGGSALDGECADTGDYLFEDGDMGIVLLCP